MSIKTVKKRLIQNKDAQLLLIAGITMSILIITLSTIAISLSDITITSFDKSSSIQPDFDNIRREFGLAMNQKLEGKLSYSKESIIGLIETYFNETRETFAYFIESYHSNYFNAELQDIVFNNEGVAGIYVYLTMSNDKESIYETVCYDL